MTSNPRTARPASAPTLANKPATLWIVLTSYLVIVLDISIVVTALPRIQTDLGFSTASLSWVHSAYTLAFGGLLLLGARAGDVFGRVRMFLLGLALFTGASLLISLAPTAGVLLVARALQGVGAAILAPSTLALLTATFAEGPDRTRAVAQYGAVAGIGASLGLVVGGLFADLLNWRYGFMINVPIGITLFLAARRYLVESPRVAGRFDLLGAATSTAGMTSLVYALVVSHDLGWQDAQTLGTLAAGVVLLGSFALIEHRAEQPIMPPRLFASPERTGAFLGRMLYLGAMMGFWFFITQYLQRVLGFTPFQAGLGFFPMTLVNFAVALTVPRLTRRFGNPTLLAIGVTVTAVGMIWLSQVTLDSSYVTAVALPMLLIGAGQGLSLSPLTASGVAGVAPADAGAASGLVNVAHQLGGSLGLGLLVALAATAGHGSDPITLTRGVSIALTAGSALLGVTLILVLALIVRPHRDQRGRNRHT